MHVFLRDLPHPFRQVRRIGRSCIRFCQHRVAHVYPQPVIIGGSPKSGTTAIAALLAKAVGTRFSNDPFWHVLYHDSKDFLLPDILEGRLTVDAFVQRFSAYFQAGIVKDPDFAFLYPQLKARFPHSPQVFVVRDPRDNIRSILNRLKLPGNLRELEPEDNFIPPSDKGWRAIIDGRGLAISSGNYVSRLSQRWSLGVHGYLDAQSSIHLVRYEDFMADKVAVIEQLAEDLGLRVVNDISGEDRQYQPRGGCGVAPEKFFGRDNLRIIETTCAKAMSALGYAGAA
ncbi:MAG TPA: sulfotransferase [Frateuria sp.]|uniref:sulfotransferase family protein n=1 Tax=Frateuria sp. TaxID=2211372 RepID=UPI002DF0D83E|nr:sulfotransferase [Frateuria sp.]